MQIDDKMVIDAIQKASKVDSIEKLLWDIKASIKQDLTAAIQHSNQLQVEQFKNSIGEILKEFRKEEIDHLVDDVAMLKSDKKALKWVAGSISAFVTFIGSVVTLIITK